MLKANHPLTLSLSLSPQSKEAKHHLSLSLTHHHHHHHLVLLSLEKKKGKKEEEEVTQPMSFLTGNPKNSWQPTMTVDTTTRSYWINWRVILCAVWILVTTIFASIVIWKFEGSKTSKHDERDREQKKESEGGLLYEDEVWKPCLKHIHPAWLLAFRVFAFVVLLVLLIVTAFADGGSIFFFYTQWTFTLVTIYFGLGSLLSMYGCYQYHKRVGGNRIDNDGLDEEQGTSTHEISSTMSNVAKISGPREGSHHAPKTAGMWSYVFQIIFQMNAGAVLLTDFVFWFIIVPFLAIKDYNLNFLIINMHSINAVLLLADTALNSLRFPWFRIAYFFLWTCVYVVFQWVLHACVSLWWPYPFLDLSSQFAPLWYSSVALMHIPCYGIFALIMKLKHHLLSKWFPESYQCVR